MNHHAMAAKIGERFKSRPVVPRENGARHDEVRDGEIGLALARRRVCEGLQHVHAAFVKIARDGLGVAGDALEAQRHDLLDCREQIHREAFDLTGLAFAGERDVVVEDTHAINTRGRWRSLRGIAACLGTSKGGADQPEQTAQGQEKLRRLEKHVRAIRCAAGPVRSQGQYRRICAQT